MASLPAHRRGRATCSDAQHLQERQERGVAALPGEPSPRPRSACSEWAQVLRQQQELAVPICTQQARRAGTPALRGVAPQAALHNCGLVPLAPQGLGARRPHRGHLNWPLGKPRREKRLPECTTGTPPKDCIVLQKRSKQRDVSLGSTCLGQRPPSGRRGVRAAGHLDHLGRQRPVILGPVVGGTKLAADAEKHVPHVRAGEQWPRQEELRQRAPCRPQVHTDVPAGAQEQLRRAVPARPNVGADEIRGCGLAEVAQFQSRGSTTAAFCAHENVLRLHVTVHEARSMHRSESREQALGGPAHLRLLQTSTLRLLMRRAVVEVALDVLED
mmetsp:Transcript_93130/g.208066  ORF Transcript_93130/g.208066 Transcript_93130/m.208066 type:complete len:329 (-) Transcript_93130:384-1370(-)